MEENPGTPPASTTQMDTPLLPAGNDARKNSKTWIFVLVALVVLGLLVAAIVLLLGGPAETTGKIRDVFIIFLALESLITGAVLIILVVQISLLINLLQNEIKPILETTNETVNTLKGTTTFISSNLAEPVIKLNEYLAGLKKFLDLLFVFKK
jgi:hypothetical protein